MKYRRRLHLNREEYASVLDRMDAPGGGHGTDRSEVRARPRHNYRITDIPLAIEHPEGGTSWFLVNGRNISRSGISVLHGGYLHIGSDCKLILRRAEGPLAVTGAVMHCRLVAGSCHEIGIRFHEEIDPALLVSPEDLANANGMEADNPMTIRGSLLIVEPFAPDRELLELHLSMFDVDTRVATTPGAAVDSVKRNQIDLILLSLNLRDDEGIGTIKTIRRAGFDGPIILLTTETEAKPLDEAREAGGTAVVPKPYHLDFLVAQLQAHLTRTQSDHSLFSTITADEGMNALIAPYVDTVHELADQIERSVAAGDWTAVREDCCRIKGSGCSYGFQPLTVAAMTALESLDSGAAEEGKPEAIMELVQCCRLTQLPRPDAA